MKKTIKKAQLGGLLKAGMKAVSKMTSKSVPKAAAKTASKITDDEMKAAITQSQRNAMKARFKELDKEDVIKKLKSGEIPVKGPKGGGLFPMDKKRSGGKIIKKSAKKK